MSDSIISIRQSYVVWVPFSSAKFTIHSKKLSISKSDTVLLIAIIYFQDILWLTRPFILVYPRIVSDDTYYDMTGIYYSVLIPEPALGTSGAVLLHHCAIRLYLSVFPKFIRYYQTSEPGSFLFLFTYPQICAGQLFGVSHNHITEFSARRCFSGELHADDENNCSIAAGKVRRIA